MSGCWWEIGRVISGHFQNHSFFFSALLCRTTATAVGSSITDKIRRRRASGGGQIVIVVLALQQSHHRAAQRRGENRMLKRGPAFALHVIRDRAGRASVRAVPPVLLVERFGAGVSKSGTDLNVPVKCHNVILFVALVLDAEIVGQATVAVQGAAGVRKKFHGLVEGDLVKKTEKDDKITTTDATSLNFSSKAL